MMKPITFMTERQMKARVGVLVMQYLVLSPIVLWFLSAPLELRFGDFFMTMTSFGQMTGLIGVSLYALTLILSARFEFLEDFFGGIDRMYNIHHITGTFAFTFLLVHPLFLAVRFIPLSIVDAALSLVPGSDWAINFGIIALVLMMSFLTVTFVASWRYQALKFAHKFLGLAFMFGALHAFLVPSDLSRSPLLKWYMLALIGVALLSYTYRTIFGGVLVKRYAYVVHAVNDLGNGVTEVVMHPDGERMHYFPGQFIFISFRDAGMSREVHPFTISSAPTEEALRITVKALGDWTTELKNLNIGAVAMVEGPFGRFSYLTAEHKKQIWVAGGIGVTPFLNMLRNLRINKRPDLHIDFYYSTKTAGEVVFRSEIESIVNENPNIRFFPWGADEKGFLSVDAIRTVSGDLSERDIYVCGPPPMMKGLVAQFKMNHVPDAYVHTEAFKLL